MGNLIDFVIHKVGNQTTGEPLFLGKEKVKADGETRDHLATYFLSAFKDEEYYQFFHQIDISMNEVYRCVSAIFGDPGLLFEQSRHLARHLYDASTHPKIKGGELYIAYFSDCHLDGSSYPAVGIFKSENKDVFLQVETVSEGFEVESRQGININKLDKGCLIYNTQKEAGYILSIVDNTNKGIEAQYWKDDFLGVMIFNNAYHQTNQFLGMAKLFVSKQLEHDFEISKTDKIDYLNRSVDYFKTRDTFDKDEFAETVFGHQEVIESFKKFDTHFRNEHDLEADESFEISAPAVKRQARIFKSVLKLDKNFHIYIHGNRELIEQGVDEHGRKFYKIFYEHEA